MDRLYAIAKKHNLRIVEDAAQALGSEWNGQKIGALGDLVSFSFQANKNITSSEGGCLVLNNAEEARLAEKYRLQGVTRTGHDGLDVDVLGGKFNMTDVAAASAWASSPTSMRSRPTAVNWPNTISSASAVISKRNTARSYR
ncbi:UDP-4-amino-4-deoxy-L-arabinose--oxoglutarate aminotransferase (EC 2.6.1.87) [Pseudomonas sp. FEN]|nr:UDP-4-amino-4-deoxy-L-arabinose--oxoglutarate aminotransferase (EC 2.6.1.87) [Pseudomonas sp. FEN]